MSWRRARRNLLRVVGRASAMPTHPFVHDHRRRLKTSDVFVVSYPRSGNTWMRLLLADIIQQDAGWPTETNLPIDYDDIIPDLDCGYWPTPEIELTLSARLFKTHSVFHPVVNNAIVVFRNPADCLCSYFHFFRRLDPSNKCIRKGIDAFCLHNVDDWSIHVDSYLRASRDGALRSFWTSYEQLHTRPHQVLKTAALFLGLSTTDAACQKAIENQSFDKRRANERLGPKFHEYFFRAGEINSGLDELRADTIDTIERKTRHVYERAVGHLTKQQVGLLAPGRQRPQSKYSA